MAELASPDQVHVRPHPADVVELTILGVGQPAQHQSRPRQMRRAGRVRRWWRKHITPDVVLEECRDHLGLERTFLAYVRTSNAFASFGIAAAQLYRLQDSVNSSQVSTFFRLGRPLGATSVALAMLIVLVGAHRCWQQQQSMIAGKVKARGWELWTITSVTFISMAILLAFNIGDAATAKPV